MWTESRSRSWDVRQAEICVRFTADLSAGLVYKKDRIQPETNAGTSHDLVLSRDRLQGRMAEKRMTYGEESVLKKRGKVRRIL